MAGSDELVVGKFDPYSDELAITQDHSVIAHVYGSDAGTVKAMALDFVLGRERAQKAEAEKARLQALLAERDAEIKGLVEAAVALTAKSPCFITIRPGGNDIECCQFCLEDNAHAPGCEWVGLVAALAARGGAS